QLKSRDVASEITVLEQNPRGATYGFGVALAGTAIDKLSGADQSTVSALQEKMFFGNSQVMENCTGEFTLQSELSNGAITRLDILTVLEGRCSELGIQINHDVRVDDLDTLDDFDLIVGADGPNSAVRTAHESEFGTRFETRGNYFIWYGCQHTRQEAGLRFRRHQGHSIMTHYYAYTPDMWTFVGETDQQSWKALGMDKMTDDQRKALCEEVFDDILEGRPLISNNSRWVQFVAMSNERWSVGNRVLIGDALSRAHYSIGSGTRLAMEDALGLVSALEAHPGDIPTALRSFEELGKPKKQKLMAACEGSYKWYEQVHEKLDMPILDFVYDYMCRTGRMPMDRLKLFAPGFVEAYESRVA
ncbi:MAG: FAD-dependent monooxygenase, partial [Pseudomonadota bacterium]